MADLRPFRALRYRPDIVGDVGSALAPPYDVIDAEGQAALRDRSPYNVIRLELSLARDDNGAQAYERAAETLRDWRQSGALAAEERPALYQYTQEFEHEGGRLTRKALLARMRLEPWEAGVMRPHEATGAAAKQDRLQLLRHLHANVSPVFALYRDPDGRVADVLSRQTVPLLEAATADGQRHTLHGLTDEAAIEAVSAALRDTPLYIADGHHRYETALNYRDERRQQAASWTGEEPENFILVALTAVEDPGLVNLPTHRLVRPPSLPSDLIPRLERFFHVEDTSPRSYDSIALLRLMARLTASGRTGTAFGALGLEEGRLHLLTLKDARAANALMPSHSAAWQALDVNVLEYAVLREALGVESGAEGMVDFTEDAAQALRELEAGRWPLAFLLNSTPIEQVLAVADAGELMPRKSTFFYPKLPTGLVLHSFD